MNVVGGCRFYAVNMDRWRFPEGGGNIRNVTLSNFTIRKMPDSFSSQRGAEQRPLIHIKSAFEGLRIENFQRPAYRPDPRFRQRPIQSRTFGGIDG